jgi:hypothetical protein
MLRSMEHSASKDVKSGFLAPADFATTQSLIDCKLRTTQSLIDGKLCTTQSLIDCKLRTTQSLIDCKLRTTQSLIDCKLRTTQSLIDCKLRTTQSLIDCKLPLHSHESVSDQKDPKLTWLGILIPNRALDPSYIHHRKKFKFVFHCGKLGPVFSDLPKLAL